MTDRVSLPIQCSCAHTPQISSRGVCYKGSLLPELLLLSSPPPPSPRLHIHPPAQPGPLRVRSNLQTLLGHPHKGGEHPGCDEPVFSAPRPPVCMDPSPPPRGTVGSRALCGRAGTAPFLGQHRPCGGVWAPGRG